MPLFPSFAIVRPALKASIYCKGIGNEDTGLAQFLSDCVSKGLDGVIDVPVTCNAAKTITGMQQELSCVGSGSLTFNAGVDGLFVDNSALVADNSRPFGSNRLDIYTKGAGVGKGFKFKGSSTLGNKLIKAFEIQNIHSLGINNSTGWGTSISFEQAVNGTIRSIQGRGKSDLTSGTTATHLEIFNGCNGIDFGDVTLDWGDYGIRIVNSGAACEGMRIDKLTSRAVKYGFVSEAPGNYHRILNSHFDTTRRGVQFGTSGITGSDFSEVSHALFLRSVAEALAGLDYVAIDHKSNYGAAVANQMLVDSSTGGGATPRWNQSYGMIIGSSTDASKSGEMQPKANSIFGFQTPITLESSTRSNDVAKNYISAYGNAAMVSGGIVDNATQNVTSDVMVYDSAGLQTFNLKGGKTVIAAMAYTSANLNNVTGNGMGSGIGPVTITKNYGGGMGLTGLFTAPVTATYPLFAKGVVAGGIAGAPNFNTMAQIILTVNGINYVYEFDPILGFGFAADLFPMTQGQTAFVTISVPGALQNVSIAGGNYQSTHFAVGQPILD